MKIINPVPTKAQEYTFEQKLKEKHPKYRMLWRLGSHSGLRVSDLLKIKLRDIQPVTAVTENKTGKTKVITLDAEFYTEIQEYAREQHIEPGHYLFFRHRWEKTKHISRTQAWRVLHTTATEIGLESIGTHSMRKTYAKSIYELTGDLSAVQTALNHKYSITTMAYLMKRGQKLAIVDADE